MIEDRIELKRWIVARFLFAISCTASVAVAERELTIDRIASLPTLTGTPPARPVWSPTGDRVAFQWNDRGCPFHDLWVVRAAGGDSGRVTDLNRGAAEPEAVRATGIGLPPIGFIPGARYNRPDRGIGSYRWSPDGRYVALEVDDFRNVRREAIPNYVTLETEVRHLRRAYPGDHDEERTIEIYSVESGRLERVPLEEKDFVERFVYTKVAEHFDRHLGRGPRPLPSETSNDR